MRRRRSKAHTEGTEKRRIAIFRIDLTIDGEFIVAVKAGERGLEIRKVKGILHSSVFSV